MEHGPSDAGTRGERRPQKRSKTKEAQKKFYEERLQRIENEQVEVESHIFKGVSVYIEGYMDGISAWDLKKLVLQNSGKVCHFFKRKTTTHMVCTVLSAAKLHRLVLSKKKPTGLLHFVHPNWITESIKAGKLLLEEPYAILTKSGNMVDYLAPKSSTIPTYTTSDNKQNTSKHPLEPEDEGRKKKSKFQHCITSDTGEKQRIDMYTPFATLPPLPTVSTKGPFQSRDLFSNLKANSLLAKKFPKAHPSASSLLSPSKPKSTSTSKPTSTCT